MRKRNSRHRKRGLALILTMLIGMILVGIVGLALDTGFVLLVGHQLQNAADAAALAGALRVSFDITSDTQQAAADIALLNSAGRQPVELQLNDSNDPAGDIVIGRFDRDTRVFTPTLSAPNAVKVVARRTESSLGGPVPIFFGPVFGVEHINTTRLAIAMSSGSTGAGMIVLCGDCYCALKINGTPNVNLNGGTTQVNSADDCAVCGVGSALFNAPEINVVGETCFTSNVEFQGEVNTGMPPISDPLRLLPRPVWEDMADLGTVAQSNNVTTTINAGYYSGGITQTGGTLLCNPGIYVLDGPGLSIGGNSTFIAEGVMLYVRGTGVVDIGGSGLTRITPPDPELYTYDGVGTYERVSIFQARPDDGDCGDSRINGTSLLDLQGTLYFPCAALEISGEGAGFGDQLIAWTMWIHGTGDITVTYEGDFPAPGFRPFLVQ